MASSEKLIKGGKDGKSGTFFFKFISHIIALKTKSVNQSNQKQVAGPLLRFVAGLVGDSFDPYAGSCCDCRDPFRDFYARLKSFKSCGVLLRIMRFPLCTGFCDVLWVS